MASCSSISVVFEFLCFGIEPLLGHVNFFVLSAMESNSFVQPNGPNQQKLWRIVQRLQLLAGLVYPEQISEGRSCWVLVVRLNRIVGGHENGYVREIYFQAIIVQGFLSWSEVRVFVDGEDDNDDDAKRAKRVDDPRTLSRGTRYEPWSPRGIGTRLYST